MYECQRIDHHGAFSSIYFIFICGFNSVNKRRTKDRWQLLTVAQQPQISPTSCRLLWKEKLFNDLKRGRQLIHQTTATPSAAPAAATKGDDVLNQCSSESDGKKNEKSFVLDFHTSYTQHSTTQMCHQFKICHLIEFPLQISKPHTNDSTFTM